MIAEITIYSDPNLNNSQTMLNFMDNRVEDGGFQIVPGFRAHLCDWAESTRKTLSPRYGNGVFVVLPKSVNQLVLFTHSKKGRKHLQDSVVPIWNPGVCCFTQIGKSPRDFYTQKNKINLKFKYVAAEMKMVNHAHIIQKARKAHARQNGVFVTKSVVVSAQLFARNQEGVELYIKTSYHIMINFLFLISNLNS